jgi:hypothetical protein
MNTEEDEFNRIEREAKLRMEAVNAALDKRAENARELGLDYEPVQDSGIVTAGGFDPRTQRTWVELSHEEISYQAKKDDHAVHFALGALWAEAKLKEKNT